MYTIQSLAIFVKGACSLQDPSHCWLFAHAFGGARGLWNNTNACLIPLAASAQKCRSRSSAGCQTDTESLNSVVVVVPAIRVPGRS